MRGGFVIIITETKKESISAPGLRPGGRAKGHSLTSRTALSCSSLLLLPRSATTSRALRADWILFRASPDGRIAGLAGASRDAGRGGRPGGEIPRRPVMIRVMPVRHVDGAAAPSSSSPRCRHRANGLQCLADDSDVPQRRPGLFCFRISEITLILCILPSHKQKSPPILKILKISSSSGCFGTVAGKRRGAEGRQDAGKPSRGARGELERHHCWMDQCPPRRQCSCAHVNDAL